MSRPLDAYDLRDWATDSKRCWELAIAEMRRATVLSGRAKPLFTHELDLIWGW